MLLLLNLLTVAFIVLKLTHVIAWSWFFVLLPFTLPWLIAGITFLLILVGIVW